MNVVLETMRARGSVRDYLDAPIGDDALAALTDAALAAPTSLDLQEIKFYFIQNRAVLREIETAVIEKARQRGEDDYLARLAERDWKVLFGAPLLVVVAVNTKNNYIDVDAGIAVQNLALAAKSVGLDSVIMAAPDRVFVGEDAQRFVRRLGFPAGYRFAISIAIGRAASPKTPHTPTPGNIVRI